MSLMTNDTNLMENTKTKDRDAIDVNNYVEHPWSIIESYFRGKHLKQLVRHQI